MKYIFIVAVTLFSWNDPLKVSKINSAKSAAREAFNSGDYPKAIQQYRYLIDSLGVKEDEVMLNLANSYYLQKDTANAIPLYQNLASSTKGVINSKANQQLGVMVNQKGKSEEALRHFKQAIKADPSNEEARYNYEMLKKKLDKNKDDKKDNKDKNDKDKNKNEEPSEFAKRLKAQADQMVSQKQYKAAYDLMTDGLKKDKTVSTYQQYINRIKDVAEINK